MAPEKKKKMSARKRRPYRTGFPEVDRLIGRLFDGPGVPDNDDLLVEFMVTAYKLRVEAMDRGDVKMLNTALKELRYALKTFFPYRHVRKVALFGSARTPRKSAEYRQAREFAKAVVRAGWMVITGGASGIMHAGNEGAGRANSFGANIRLPFEQEANPHIVDDPKLINFKYFFTRKLIFIRESSATVLCPGGFGTFDEGYETLTLIQTGKTDPRPVVCLDPPGSRYWSSWRSWMRSQLEKGGMIDPEDINLIDFTHDPIEAARIVSEFYSNYQSSRYIGDLLVLRVKKPLEPRQLAELNDCFKSIVKKGRIRQQLMPFEEEANESSGTQDLARISFYFNRRDCAKLKLLIETINRM